MNLIRRAAVLGLLVASFAITGCGGDNGSKEVNLSPVEQARADITTATKKAGELRAQIDEISASTDASYDEAHRLRRRALDLIEAGDIDGGKELDRKATAIDQKAGPELQEHRRLLDGIDKALDEQSSAQTRLEVLLGCDRDCRRERHRMAVLSSNCMMKATRELGSLSRRAFRICNKQFPMPALPGE